METGNPQVEPMLAGPTQFRRNGKDITQGTRNLLRGGSSHPTTATNQDLIPPDLVTARGRDRQLITYQLIARRYVHPTANAEEVLGQARIVTV